MADDSKQPSEELLDLYDKLLATHPELERKGATMPYTSLNGNMFTFLGEKALAIRLPEREREQFLKDHSAVLYEVHGRVLKEYVTVPEDLLKNTEALQHYLGLSYEYVASLKPKPSKKKSG